MTDLHIAVFAKAPTVGYCKTRLIPLLGPEGATKAHCEMTMHALRIATAVAPTQVSLWSAGDHGHEFFQRAIHPIGAMLYRQCEGDLGQRMAHCLQTLLLHHARVLLIGSDCPVMTAADLHSAAHALHSAAMVFIPSEDGGYVLVGASGSARKSGLDVALTSIAWSTASVMQQTRQRLATVGRQVGIDWIELPSRWDVDEPADFQRALREGLLR